MRVWHDVNAYVRQPQPVKVERGTTWCVRQGDKKRRTAVKDHVLARHAL